MHSRTPSPHQQPRLPYCVSHHNPWASNSGFPQTCTALPTYAQCFPPLFFPYPNRKFLTKSSWATEYLLTPTWSINYLNTTLKLNRVPSNHILKTQPVYSPCLMDRVKTNTILPWKVKARSGDQGAKAGTPECQSTILFNLQSTSTKLPHFPEPWNPPLNSLKNKHGDCHILNVCAPPNSCVDILISDVNGITRVLWEVIK